MRQPDVIMTNMASDVDPMGDAHPARMDDGAGRGWAIAKSAEPTVMSHGYINFAGGRPQNPVSTDGRKTGRRLPDPCAGREILVVRRRLA